MLESIEYMYLLLVVFVIFSYFCILLLHGCAYWQYSNLSQTFMRALGASAKMNLLISLLVSALC